MSVSKDVTKLLCGPSSRSSYNVPLLERDMRMAILDLIVVLGFGMIIRLRPSPPGYTVIKN